MSIIIYCDGLCEPINPNGIATYGFVVYRDGTRMHEDFGVTGVGQGMSNNVAEYDALCKAFDYLKSQGLTAQEVIVRSDTRLLIKQMSGAWKKRPKGLYAAKYLEAHNLQRSFNHVKYQWISRELNKEADVLTREAYKNYCKTKGIRERYYVMP